MIAYRKRCVICGGIWIPHSRHVNTDGQVEDCRLPNLDYIEWMYDKGVKNEL